MHRATLALLLTTFCAFAQNTAAPATTKVPKINFTDTTLDNGLRVILSEDHYAPMYAIVVSYKVPYDNVQIIAVGDSAKIKESLAKFGTLVEVLPDSN